MEIFNFSDRVDVETVGAAFWLRGDFEFLDSDLGGGRGAEVALVDDGKSSFTEFLA